MRCIRMNAVEGAANCPHVLLSTHFHALIDALDTDQDAISYETLEVLRRGATLEFQVRRVAGDGVK